MKEREAGVIRLNPSLGNSRYYYLWQLRKAIEYVVKRYVFSLGKGLRIADFGCGNSPYQPLFESLYEQYIKIDLPDNPKADIHVVSEGKVDMPDNQVHVILSTQVLEHVPNPQLYLSEAYRVLAPAGLLILSTHGYWMYHPDPTDFWRWTSMGLQKIIQEAGFEILELRGIMGRSAMGMQLVQDGLIFKLPKWLRPLFSIPMQLGIFLLDLTHSTSARNLDACTFVVVARKQS